MIRVDLDGFFDRLLASGERPVELFEIEHAREIRWIMADARAEEPSEAEDRNGESPRVTEGQPSLGILSRTPAETNYPTFEDEPDEMSDPPRWSSFLPIGGEAAREAGFELPLPFGFSANYIHIDRDIDVEDIEIGINGAPKRSVSNFLQVDSNSSVDVAIGRFDLWLLPFLNVYAYGGWQRNDSAVEVAVSIPTPGNLPPIEFVVKDDGEIDGPVYGTGFALAGGYEQFFATATFDFAFAEFDEFDSRFEGRIYSLRGGWHGDLLSLPTRLWTGFSYFDTETTIDGSVDVPGVGRVRFEVEQGPDNPWNGVLGVGIAVPYNGDLVAEYGFNFDDIQMFTGGATLRF